LADDKNKRHGGGKNKPRQIFSAKQKDAEIKREWPKIISFFSRGKIMAGALFLGQEKKQQK